MRRGGAAYLDLVIDNVSGSTPVAGAALKFNVNQLGLSPASPAVNFPAIAVGASGYASVAVAHNPASVGASASWDVLQCALRDNNSGRVLFFNVPLGAAYAAFFTEGAPMAVPELGAYWKGNPNPDAMEVVRLFISSHVKAQHRNTHNAPVQIKELASADAGVVTERLARANVYSVLQVRE